MALRRKASTTTLTFGEDWIEVRTDRKYGDTVLAQRAAAGRLSARSAAARRKEGDDDVDVTFDISSFNLSLLASMIIAWSDKEPVTEENIQELPDDVIQEVLQAITGGSETEDEKAPLESSSTSPSESQEENGKQETPTIEAGQQD
jgi:hypothetical protein